MDDAPFVLFSVACKGERECCHRCMSPAQIVESVTNERVQIDWQWPCTFCRTLHHDGKFSPAWGGGTPSPFQSIYHNKQSCGVRSRWEGRYAPSISPPPFSPLWRVLSDSSNQMTYCNSVLYNRESHSDVIYRYFLISWLWVALSVCEGGRWCSENGRKTFPGHFSCSRVHSDVSLSSKKDFRGPFFGIRIHIEFDLYALTLLVPDPEPEPDKAAT